MTNASTKACAVTAPDLGAAAALMQRSWRQPCWRYTPEVLRDYLQRPSSAPELTIGLARDDELVGLFAGVPTDVRYRDTVQPAIFTTFLTVDPLAGDVTLAMQLYRRLLGTARGLGRTHAYTVFFPDKETTKSVVTMFRLAGAPMEILSDIDFVVGPRPLVEPRLRTEATGDVELVPYGIEHLQVCADLLGQRDAGLPLAMLTPATDIDFVLGGAPATTTLLLRQRGRWLGLISGREREIARSRPQRNLQIDHWFVADVEAPVRNAFLDRALAAFFATGVDSVSVPLQAGLRREDFLHRGFLAPPHGAALAVAYLGADSARVDKGLPSFFEVF